MRVAVTGATGLIGRRLVKALRDRGDEVVGLSRSGSEGVAWDAAAGPAPASALSGCDAVVHLAGEPVAQRWTAAAKERIRASREEGTRNLVAGLRAADPRPGVLASASGVGYYGARGDEVVTEEQPPGEDFLARVCVAWEREAQAAQELGMRVAVLRTGVVLDRGGGALGKMLLPFRLGIGGPVAGGRQWMPWIALDDMVGLYLAAIDDPAWSGAFNGSAPEPVTNGAFSKALGRALHRPAIAPVPGLALRTLYGEMGMIVTTGQRAVPSRALAAGHTFAYTDVESALRAALR